MMNPAKDKTDEFDTLRRTLEDLMSELDILSDRNLEDTDSELLDMGLLIEILDRMNEDSDKTVNIVTEFLSSISYLFHNTLWSDLSSTNSQMNKTPRPKMCIICNSVDCRHVKLGAHLDIEEIMSMAIEKCIHEINPDNEIFDFVCMRCVMESCDARMVDAEEINRYVRVLWDARDLLDFYLWTEKITEKEIKYN